jgi:ubiquinone biosynthesis protein Coq4
MQPPLLRRLRGYAAGLELLRDPTKLGAVWEIDAAIPDQAATYAGIAAAMRVHPHAARALADRPRLLVDLASLRALPHGTLGRATARFFDEHGLDPRSIPTLEDGDEITWARAHLYETHDVWHVATGYATDIPGEVALQAFYAAQLPVRLPHFLLAGGLLNAALWDPGDFKARVAAIAHGWEAGARAKPLFGVRWGDLWSEPLLAVREDLALRVDGDDPA